MRLFELPISNPLDTGAKKATAVGGALALTLGMGFGVPAAFADSSDEEAASPENAVENVADDVDTDLNVEDPAGEDAEAPEAPEGEGPGDDAEQPGEGEEGDDSVETPTSTPEESTPAPTPSEPESSEREESDVVATCKIFKFEQVDKDGTDYTPGAVKGYSEGDRVPMRITLTDLTVDGTFTITVGYNHWDSDTPAKGYKDPEFVSAEGANVVMGEPMQSSESAQGTVTFTITPTAEDAEINFDLLLSKGLDGVYKGAGTWPGASLHARIVKGSGCTGDGNRDLPVHRPEITDPEPSETEPEESETTEPTVTEPSETEPTTEPTEPSETEPTTEEPTTEEPEEPSSEKPSTEEPTEQPKPGTELPKTGVNGALATLGALFAVAGAGALMVRRNALR